MVRKLIRQNRSLLKTIHIFSVLFAWLWIGYILFFINPAQWQSVYYAPFFISLFLAGCITIRLFTKIWIVYLLIPLGFIGIIAIRIFLIKDIINPLLITGLVFTLIYFFTSGNSNAILSPKSSSIDKSLPENIDNYASFPQKNRPESGAGH